MILEAIAKQLNEYGYVTTVHRYGMSLSVETAAGDGCSFLLDGTVLCYPTDEPWPRVDLADPDCDYMEKF